MGDDTELLNAIEELQRFQDEQAEMRRKHRERLDFFMKVPGVVLLHTGSGVKWKVESVEETEVSWNFMMDGNSIRKVPQVTIRSLNSGKKKVITTAVFKYEIVSIPKAAKVLYDSQI